MKILILDPSINDVGWAVWNSKAKNRLKAWKWGTIKLSGINYAERLMDLIDQLDTLLPNGFDILVTEWPAFYSSQKGHIAAHQNYTIDLAGICFWVAGWYRMDHRHHFPMTAKMWKGSVPKLVTQRKFLRTFGKQARSMSEHAIDATMMGHYWLTTYGEKAFKVLREEFKPELI